MQIAHNDWVTLVNGCQVFKSQVPLPACSDSAGEAAEGVPSCNTIQGGGSANIHVPFHSLPARLTLFALLHMVSRSALL